MIEVRVRTSSEKVEELLAGVDKGQRGKFVVSVLEKYAAHINNFGNFAPGIQVNEGIPQEVENFMKHQSKTIIQLTQTVEQLNNTVAIMQQQHIKQLTEMQQQIMASIQSVQQVAPAVQLAEMEEAKQETVQLIEPKVVEVKKQEEIKSPVVPIIEEDDDLFAGLIIEEDEEDFSIDPLELENLKNSF